MQAKKCEVDGLPTNAIPRRFFVAADPSLRIRPEGTWRRIVPDRATQLGKNSWGVTSAVIR
jgi:hypothetical protein